MGTPYTASTTATQVAVDLSSEIEGKVVLTTGVSPGSLGAFFVSTVAKHSPKLIVLAGRDFSKLQAVVAAITADPASS